MGREGCSLRPPLKCLLSAFILAQSWSHPLMKKSLWTTLCIILSAVASGRGRGGVCPLASSPTPHTLMKKVTSLYSEQNLAGSIVCNFRCSGIPGGGGGSLPEPHPSCPHWIGSVDEPPPPPPPRIPGYATNDPNFRFLFAKRFL